MSRVDAVWSVGRYTIGTLVRLLTPLRNYGAERVPRTGGVVLAFNHFHWIDPPVFGLLSPRSMSFVAKVEAHRIPGLGQLIRSFGTISVRRGESDREAVRQMREAVRAGNALGLFVEGTRQLAGVPGHVQPGAAMVALQEDVPIVPAAIRGSYEWKPGNFHPISVAWGEPIRFDGLPKGAQGLPRGLRPGAGADPRAPRLARRDGRARPPGARDAAGMSETETPEAQQPEIIGTVAIVGFPNVGKSTLINRLTESRQAVVHETPGVTRDRKELLADWNGKHFLLIDTGGVDDLATDPFSPEIAKQARAAIAEADLVLFVVDARHGITPGDEELATILRASKKPVLVLANKIDDPRRDLEAVEFHKLGLGDPFPLSGSARPRHRRPARPDRRAAARRGPAQVGEEAIRVAILGRPNVGKSSLLNALVGAERVIVSEVPGTTRDTVDTILERDGRTYQLVDTAGLRRKRKQRQGIDYYSELRALEAAERADVALVLIDASEGIVDQDLHVADVARKAGNSTLVVLSKWDETEVTIEDVRPRIEAKLRQRPPLIAVSSKTGRGLDRLLQYIADLFDKHTGRIPTPALNNALAELRQAGSRRRRRASGSTSSTAPRSRLARRGSGSTSTTPASSRATTPTGSRTSCANGLTSPACPSRSTSSSARESLCF